MSKPMSMAGDRELVKALKSLGPRVAKKVLRQALSAGATPVVKSAKQSVATESGLLKKALGKRVKVNKRSGFGSARIGARTNVQGDYKGETRVPWRYGHLVELGHIDSLGNHVAAQPYLRPAADENETKVVQVMGDKLAEGIKREAKRHG